MRFWLENVLLWYQTGGLRKLDFRNDCVNVITGPGSTGKSTILKIFDYCFFASRSKIPESVINENVAWYGIRFHINDKTYTLARTALKGGQSTDDYFFSPSGEIPQTPIANNDEETLKAIIETEFGIDRSIAIPFGGRSLKLGSKVSLRYFLLFTSLSGDIITSSSVFFDKQDEGRYVEALERVFDLAVGIENIANLLAKSEQTRLEGELNRLQRKISALSTGKEAFAEEITSLVGQAKEYSLIDPELATDESVQILKAVIAEPDGVRLSSEVSMERSQLRSDIALANRVVRNLRLLKQEYDEYRGLLKTVEDSLRPVVFLRNNLGEVVQTSIFDRLLESISADLSQVKEDIKKRVPIDTNIRDLIGKYEQRIAGLKERLAALPDKSSALLSDRERFLFLGEAKAKLELYGVDVEEGELQKLTDKLNDVSSRLESSAVSNPQEAREQFLSLLEEIALEYMEHVKAVLGKYAGYRPVFDYRSKSMKLRRPKSPLPENIGSSSNDMFLHLILFLSLHESIKIQESPFVPPFIMIDQPSRPYWGDPKNRKLKLEDSDEAKVRAAFELLNAFATRMLEKDEQFQLIVFEHVPPSTWEGLQNVSLVEQFGDGNALIPEEDIS